MPPRCMPRAAPPAGLVEDARDQVAALVGAEAKDVTFTAGATEANMLALTPALETANEKAPRDRLYVSGGGTSIRALWRAVCARSGDGT